MLQSVAKTLDNNVRKVDFLARYGGEEFAVIAPDTPAKGVAILAIRLREAVEQCVVDWNGQELKVTISVGAAVYSKSVDPAASASIIAAADAQLYAAKRAGRNRVQMCQDEALVATPAQS